nr:MAG TPA: hypothetical protein [Bacteriophage sp.]
MRIDKEIQKELFKMFLNCLYSWYPPGGVYWKRSPGSN